MAASLHEAGFAVEVFELPRGQVQSEPAGCGSENLGMTIRADAGLIEIRDAWSYVNDTVWIGWQAWLGDDDSLVARRLGRTKRRADVVRFVDSCARLAAPAVAR